LHPIHIFTRTGIVVGNQNLNFFTVGMNLAQFDVRIASATTKLHVWDLGGRLQSLWERYYADADCVLFCWRLAPDENEETIRAQHAALQSVRAALEPSVPLAVLANVFCPHLPAACEPELLHEANSLVTTAAGSLMMTSTSGLFFVNAQTGQGLKTAVEWLVGTTLQQNDNHNDEQYCKKYLFVLFMSKPQAVL